MYNQNFRYYEEARSSYYERLIYPPGFQNFTEITRRKYSSALKSPIPVHFKTLEFGDNQKTVIKKLGRPRFVAEENGFSPVAYFYKEDLMNHNLLIQLHFFKNEFVLATQSIIDTDLKWREIVKVTVLEKYTGKKMENNLIEERDIVFTDENNNKLFILDSINLNLTYSSGHPAHYLHIEDFTRQKIKKINDEAENLKSLLKDSF